MMTDKERLEVIRGLNYIISEAIKSIDNGEDVNGLEYAVKIADEALEDEKMSNDKPRMTLEDVKNITEKAGQYDELVKQNKRYREALQHIEENSNDKVAVFIASRALKVDFGNIYENPDLLEEIK